MSGPNFNITNNQALNQQDVVGVNGVSVDEDQEVSDFGITAIDPTFEATGHSVTITTINNERVLISYEGSARDDGGGIGGNVVLGYRIDGGSTVVISSDKIDTNQRVDIGFTVMSSALSAGPHTFELMVARGAGGETIELVGSSSGPSLNRLQIMRFQAGINTNFIINSHRKGAVVGTITDTTFNVTAGELGFSDGKIRSISSPITWDVSNDVAELGFADASDRAVASTLDASDALYAYAVPDSGDDDAFTVVLSDNPPSIGPTGYSIWRYLFFMRSNTSADFIRIRYRGNNWFHFTSDPSEHLPRNGAYGDQIFHDVDCTGFVPDGCRCINYASAAIASSNEVLAIVHPKDGGQELTSSQVASNRQGPDNNELVLDDNLIFEFRQGLSNTANVAFVVNIIAYHDTYREIY